jgi:hypothetical protein
VSALKPWYYWGAAIAWLSYIFLEKYKRFLWFFLEKITIPPMGQFPAGQRPGPGPSGMAWPFGKSIDSLPARASMPALLAA